MDVKFIETSSDKLDNLSIVNGQIIALSDKSGLYYDLSGKRYNAAYILPQGTSSILGGVKLSDSYTESAGNANAGIAASSYALVSAYNALNSNKQNASTAITTSNIGSQSVNYATSAGSANEVAWGNVSGKPSTFTPSSHTHNYAGSSSAGGAATTALACTGNAASATQLATARTIRTNLGSTSTASFNGTANITPGVTGTLGVGNGGTGSASAAAARTALGLGNVNNTADANKSVYAASCLNIISVAHSDLDYVQASGFYKVTGNAAVMIHIQWDTNFAWQMKFEYGNKIHVRYKYMSQWVSWSVLHSW